MGLRMRRYWSKVDNVSLFDLAYRPIDEEYADDLEDSESEPDESEWISVAEAVRPFHDISGDRVALGLRQAASGRSKLVFKELRIQKGEDWPSVASDGRL